MTDVEPSYGLELELVDIAATQGQQQQVEVPSLLDEGENASSEDEGQNVALLLADHVQVSFLHDSDGHGVHLVHHEHTSPCEGIEDGPDMGVETSHRKGAAFSHVPEGATAVCPSPVDAAAAVPPVATPLPAGQCAVVLAVQFCEGYQLSMLFPFVVFMVRDFGVPEVQTGVYAGALTATFCAAQFCSSYVWGYLSDRFGRKLAMLSGVVGTGIASLIFGTSSTYTQAVIARALGGLLNGNTGVVKAFLSDITDDSNRTQGFALREFSWGMGAVVGPIAGGYLSNPSWPDMQLLRSFPYFLPCATGAVLQLVSALMIVFIMVEPTHAYSKLGDADGNADSTSLHSSEHDDEEEEEAMVDDDAESPRRQLTSTPSTTAARTPVIIIQPKESAVSILWRKKPLVAAGSYLISCLAYIIFDEALPLFMATEYQFGGLGFSDHEIGGILMVNGLVLAVFTLFILPPLTRRTSLTFMMRIGFVVALLTSLAPVASYFVQLSRPATYFAMGLVMIVKACSSSSVFTGAAVLVSNAVAPRHSGIMNGFAQSFAALCRSVGPAVAGALWSLSEHMQVTGHTFLVFIVGGLVLLCGLWLTQHISKDMECGYRE